MGHGWLFCWVWPRSRRRRGRRRGCPKGRRSQRDLEYVKEGHERQRLDLYTSEKANGPTPVIVWVHGGAWMGGGKDAGVPAIPFVAEGMQSPPSTTGSASTPFSRPRSRTARRPFAG